MTELRAWPLAVFCVTVASVLYLVIAEPCITVLAKWLPRRRQQLQLRISYCVAPLVGVLVLLAAGAANGETIKRGIVGDRFIKPYGIMILFMSQAYLCTSLDRTGVFGYIAAVVTRKAGTGGHKVFAAYYVLASLLTVVTSNDVVILTITPIVCAFAKATGTDPMPLLYLEFYAANIWGMTLLIGNPTNIIIGETTDLNFLEFSKWSLLPTIASGAAFYCIMVLYFRKHIADAPETDESVEPSSFLTDRWGARFGAAVLLISLVLLAVANFIGAPLWTITLGAAGVLVAGNLYIHYLHPWLASKRPAARRLPPQSQNGAAAATTAAAAAADALAPVPLHSLQHGTTVIIPPAATPASESASVSQPETAADPPSSEPFAPAATAPWLDPPSVELVIVPADSSAHVTSGTSGAVGCGTAVGGGAAGGSIWERAFPRQRRNKDFVPHQRPPPDDMSATQNGRAAAANETTDDAAAASHACPDRAACEHANGKQQQQQQQQEEEVGRKDGRVGIRQQEQPPVALPDGAACSADATGEEMPPGFSMWATFADLPWHVVPFLFGMFIIVEALNSGGWVDFFGKTLAGATNSLFVAVFLTGAIASVLANIVNNQPMTILMARIVLSKGFDVPPRQRLAANLALIAASNVGANFSLIGSLAAVMWTKLLKSKKVDLSFWRFVKVGAATMPVPLAISLLVFWGESAAFQ